MSQCEEIAQYMRSHGSITSAQAFRDLGCTRLAARISDMRARGMEIDAVTKTGMARDGKRTRYAEYRLKED